ncbi:hypothetical protein QYM36_008464 [Artemia franciscana]|uniref:Tetraspanin n=1 Tax=Artemia franciscana TaxID=6661 RepID=A0AA88LMJ8_ARTSF|nr:hypothetical protein QYM36_008464 [Artemia franciscana]
MGYLCYGYYSGNKVVVLIISPFIIFASIVSFAIFLTRYNIQSRSYIESLIKEYSSTSPNRLDDIQTTFKCCGVNSDESAHWFVPFEVLNCKFEHNEVPKSCCRLQIQTKSANLPGVISEPGERSSCIKDPRPPTTYTKGCDLAIDGFFLEKNLILYRISNMIYSVICGTLGLCVYYPIKNRLDYQKNYEVDDSESEGEYNSESPEDDESPDEE